MSNEADKAAAADAQKAAKVRPYEGCIRRFSRAIEAIARVSAFGAAKRGRPMDDRWALEPIENIREAQARHHLRQAQGELYDPESGELHLAHEAWNVLARLELTLRAAEQKSQEAAELAFEAWF